MFFTSISHNDSRQGCALKNPEALSADLQDFAQRCLDRNPQRRANAEQLLNHQFIRKANARTKPK